MVDTDIGGYGGGKPSDPGFRELIVRWFQFGLTCPLFRQHGSRPTEIWLLGNESEAAVTKVIALRQQMQRTHRTHWSCAPQDGVVDGQHRGAGAARLAAARRGRLLQRHAPRQV